MVTGCVQRIVIHESGRGHGPWWLQTRSHWSVVHAVRNPWRVRPRPSLGVLRVSIIYGFGLPSIVDEDDCGCPVLIFSGLRMDRTPGGWHRYARRGLEYDRNSLV